MTVKSNYAIAIATLGDRLKSLTPVYQPMTCTRDFSCALSKLHGIGTNLDWFVALFALAVIGRSKY